MTLLEPDVAIAPGAPAPYRPLVPFPSFCFSWYVLAYCFKEKSVATQSEIFNIKLEFGTMRYNYLY